MVRPAAGLKAHVAELPAQNRERHAVLKSQRHCGSKSIHETGDGRALLGHLDENFSRLAVRVQTNRYVSFLPSYGEVVGDSSPLVGKPAALRTHRVDSESLVN